MSAFIEVLRGGPGGKEFFFRKMGKNYKEITRSAETYKRKATMLRIIATYEPLVEVRDLTKLQDDSFAKRRPLKKK